MMIVNKDINKKVEVENIDVLEKDSYIKLGEILMDKETGVSMFNIPLLESLDLSEKSVNTLQSCIDLFQQWLIEVLLGEEELQHIKAEAKACVDIDKMNKEKGQEE